MRFLITLTLFSIAFFAIGQNQSGTYSNNTKISDTERKRLENEFKALGSFYIDDSGVVVYQTTKNTNLIQDKDSITTEHDVPAIDTQTNEVKEESISPVKIKNTGINSPTPPNTFFYKKNLKINEISSNTDNSIPISLPEEKEIVKEQEIIEVKKDTPSTEEENSKKKKGSVLNQKRTSQYKSMEEAALAVEALLKELKKEETKASSSGNSMSSKLSRGVNKDLRKTSNARNNYSIPGQNQTNTTTDNSSFGVEPSYFINGQQVEKVEVSKLRKSDIIRREIRVRNTVTGNPNGEVWYEVK